MKKLTVSLSTLVLAAGLVAGCGSNAVQPSQPPAGKETKPPDQISFPLTVKDATGTEVTIKEEPKRIVSLAPSDTEILFALGLGDRIVGVDKYSDYPAEAKAKTVIGDMNTDTEKVVAQKPDLVIGGATLNSKAIEALRKLNVTVYAVEPKTIGEVEQAIKDIGRITNSTAKADETVKGMEQKLSDVKAKVQGMSDAQKPLVYVELSPGPDIFTAGKGTFMDEMVALAGGKNAFADTNAWAKISAEQVVAKNPQVIISTTGMPDEVKGITTRPGWDKMPAVKDNKVAAVDPNLTNRPGPRIVDGLEQFAKAIHPELFK